jgi:short-subunit dehydrogenase
MSLAVITGASSGLGVTFARKLAQSGYNLTLVARRRDRLEKVAADLMREYKIRAEPLVADLATDAGIAAASSYLDSAPELDLLVNNAGFGTTGLFFNADIASQDQMHRLHIMATMHLSHAALRRMVAQRSGGIVNVSSVAAFTVAAGSASYGSTKAWINAFTKALDAELRVIKSPVKVQALCPGFTITEFHDTLGMDRKLVPGWLWLQADEVVDDSLEALKSDKVIVVPGWQYKILVALLKRLPEFALRKLGEGSGRHMKRVAAE